MIIKSMSRKEPTFGQLVRYMSSEKSNADFDIYHHCYARAEDDLVAEFTQNSELLGKRVNGNYLYHEIISLSIAEGVDRAEVRENLREIADTYIQSRCPRNMVYGCLHEDHETHLHYHLMISANELGGTKRRYLTKKQFESVKQGLEQYVLTQYPNLKQKALQGQKLQTEKLSLKAGEMKRRTGALPERDEVRDVLTVAMLQSKSMGGFCRFLSEQGYAFYTRGKNFGVKVEQDDGASKSYRFSTLGVHEDFEKFQLELASAKPAQKPVERQRAETDKSGPEPAQTSQRRSQQPETEQKLRGAEVRASQKNTEPAVEKEKRGEQQVKPEQADVLKRREGEVRRERGQDSSKEAARKTASTSQRPTKSETVNTKPTSPEQEVDRLEREFQEMTSKKASSQKESQKDGKKHSQ